jgi:hypothetical protein
MRMKIDQFTRADNTKRKIRVNIDDVPRLVKRPDGCACEDLSWNRIPLLICSEYEPFDDDDEICAGCWHDAKCHRPKRAPE